MVLHYELPADSMHFSLPVVYIAKADSTIVNKRLEENKNA